MPSLREYATHFQIDSRRLGPRQLLMHPGPVNRGVELSGEVIDSPQSPDDRAGRLRPGGADGDPLRAARRRRATARRRSRRATTAPRRTRPRSGSRRERRRGASPRRSTCAPARAPTWSCARRRCSTRSPGSTAPTTSSSATAASPSSPRPGSAADGRRRGRRRRRPARLPGLLRPPCPPADPRPGAQGGRRNRHPLGRRRRLLRRDRDGQHRAARLHRRPTSRRCARRPARRPRCRPASWRPSTRGMEGDELTDMAELREAGALGFSDDGLPIRSAGIMRRALQYQRLCGGTIALHEEDPELSGAGVMHEGAGLGGARPGRRPLGLGVDDDRPRRGPGRLRGGADPRPAPLGRRVGRGGARRQGRPGSRSAARRPRTTSASPTRRSAASTRCASR